MTNPIDTSKNARDMNDQEKLAFLEACRKLDAAPKPPLPAVETTKRAKDLSEQERAEWLANYRRSLKQ
jgi:hypothetical protein